MAPLDPGGLRPLDTSGLEPADAGFDLSGLELLDASGLTSLETMAAPGDDIGRINTARAQLGRGLSAVFTALPKTAAIIDASGDRALLDAYNALDRGEEPLPGSGLSPLKERFLEMYRVAGPEMRAKLREEQQGELDPRQSMLFKAGAAGQQFVEEAMPVNPKYEKEFWAGKVPQGLGSALGFLGLGGLGASARVAPLATASTGGAALGAADQFESALDHGASLEDAMKSSGWGAAVGLSEGVPIARLIDRIDKGTGGSIRRLVKTTLTQGTEEAGQEAFQTIMDNLIASDIVAYDPKRAMFAGTGEAAGVGFTVGGLMNFVGQMVGGRRGGGTHGQASAEEVTSFAQQRAEALQQQATRTTAEQAELDFLNANVSNPQALGSAYGVEVQPAGVRETARAAAPVLTPEDEASPIPNELIVEGRVAVQDAVGAATASDLLAEAGFPSIDSRITLTTRDGAQIQVTLVDAYDEGGQKGAKIRLDDGRVVAASFEALRGRMVQEVDDVQVRDGGLGGPQAAAPDGQGVEAGGQGAAVVPGRDDGGGAAAPRPQPDAGVPDAGEAAVADAALTPLGPAEPLAAPPQAAPAASAAEPVRTAAPAPAVAPAQAGAAEGALPEGWTEASPGGMATNRDSPTGGIVDREIKSGKWFAVPNRDSSRPLTGFDSRTEAIAALQKTIKAPTTMPLPRGVQRLGEVYKDGKPAGEMIRGESGEFFVDLISTTEASGRLMQGPYTTEAEARSDLGMDKDAPIEGEVVGRDLAPTSNETLAGKGEQGEREQASETKPLAKVEKLFVRLGDQTAEVASLEEAQAKFWDWREQVEREGGAGMGSSEIPEVTVEDANGKQIAEFAPNGKIIKTEAGEKTWTEDSIAELYANELGHAVGEFHRRVAKALLEKDAKGLEFLSNGLNKVGKRVFTKVTGVKLPPAQGATWEAIQAWAKQGAPVAQAAPAVRQPRPMPDRDDPLFELKNKLRQMENTLDGGVHPRGRPFTADERASWQLGIDEIRSEIQAARGADATKTQKPAAAPQSAAAVPKGHSALGKNADGNPLFEDDKGVRYYTRGGVKVSESVQIIPGRGISVDTSRRSKDFLPVEEGGQDERRAEDQQRGVYDRRVEDLEPAELRTYVEELRAHLLIDERTGLGSNRAWLNREPKANVVAIDLDSLKWVNDTMGHDAGDRMIAAVGKALREAGLEAYHVSGDEFYAQADNAGALRTGVERARASLRSVTLEGEGVSFTGPSFSFGLGSTLEQAERGLNDDKSQREAAGERAARGERPPGAVDAAQVSEPEQGQGARAEAPADREGPRAERPQPGVDRPAAQELLDLGFTRLSDGYTYALSVESPDGEKRHLFNVRDIPGRSRVTRSTSYPKSGTTGAPSFDLGTFPTVTEAAEAVRRDLKHLGVPIPGRAAGQEPSPPVTIGVTQETQDGRDQRPVPRGDANAGAPDVQPAPEDRGAGRARPGDLGEGPADVQRVDRGRTEAAQRVPEGPVGEGGRGAGPRDADRVPAGERAKRPARDADRVAGENYVIEPGALAEDRGRTQKARDNIRAIELMREIEAAGRPATTAEQVELARYVGWGGLKGAFPNTEGQFEKGFEAVGKQLQEMLSATEYATARRSLQYAHYTAEVVVRNMWAAVERMGFRGGKVFEPGMGVGNFPGLMPAEVASRTDYNGLELDHTTARIARLLYPRWGVRQDDFTKAPLPHDTYDLVIGNPPFADVPIKSDAAYPQGFLLHDYFFAKSLDAVRPGGLLVFISSAGTMNKMDASAREYMADRADLVGAVRLPGNAFEKNAGTLVTTDIIVLRKRLETDTAGDRTWTETVEVTLPNKEGKATKGRANRYFVEHPEQVLGEEGFFDPLYAGRYAVRAREGVDFKAALEEAMAALPENIMSEWTSNHAEFDFGSKEHKEGSFYLRPDGTLMQQREGGGRPVERRGSGVEGGKTLAEFERIKAMIPVRDALRAVYAADLAGDTANSDLARKRLNESYDTFTKRFGPINKAEFQYRRPTVIQQESARAEAREEARFTGTPWRDGTFDATAMLEAKATLSAVAKARKEAREAAEKAGQEFDEGSFDPAEMPDVVIEKRPNIDPFMDDPESYRLRAIEKYNDESGEANKGAVFFENVITRERAPTINSVHDAMLYVLNKRGRLDIPEVAHAAGITESEAIEQLGDGIFRVPGTQDQWVTRDEYLSGHVRRKLRQAKAAAERDPELQRNVDALEAAQPAPLPPTEISANLGMPWLPTAVIEQFGKDALGLSNLRVTYTPVLAQWTVDGDENSAAARATWGTPEMSAPELIKGALNRQDPRVTRIAYDENNRKISVLDPVATQAAQDKMQEIKARFADWVWSDPERAKSLAERYNEEYNSLVAREYNGDYLTTPGIASHWQWRPHQTRVVARIIQSGNTYMAHAVGAGKTSAMIGAGMEMRRLGLVRKPMYAVPNHMLGQFTKEFYEQYPTARIMVADERRFHTDRRKQFIANVANEDLDAVIITHSAFGMIPISDSFQDGLVQQQIDQYRELLNDLDDGDNRITRSRLEKQIERLEQRLSGRGTKARDAVFTFEEMGVDFLFVDEAHGFRKLDFATKMSNVKGISPEGSKASWDLYVKTRYLETINPGRNLVLASGTPITNTMAELYTVSRYLQLAELRERGLEHFDAWASAFGDTVTNLEQTPDGGYKPVTRFAKFVNVPELSVMVRQSMDVVTSRQLEQYVTRPAIKDGQRKMNLAEKDDALEAYQATLAARMAEIAQRKGPPKPGDDIILSVINDGRHAAIDMRLVYPDLPSNPGSKLNLLVDKVFETWKATKRQTFHKPTSDGYSEKPFDKGPATQMIFANLGLSGARGFAVPDYIRAELVRRGVPKAEIAFIADYKSHVQKQRLFNDMNEGKVRILIGSTAKMATGVNAQRRLYALHNLDPLWYPADDEQRIGRALRQGNLNPEIEIHDYSTKGTYDSTMWGLMETKARFIQGFFEGDPSLRDMEDLGEASQYEQAKALTTADPRLILLTELRQKLEKAVRRKAGFEREQYANAERVAQAKSRASYLASRIPHIEADIARRQDVSGDNFKATVGRKTYTDRLEAGDALMGQLDLMKAEKRDYKDHKVGEIAGFDIVAEAWTAAWTEKGKNERKVALSLLRSGDNQTEVSLSGSARGVVQSLEYNLRGFEIELGGARERLQAAEKTVREFEPQIGKQFTNQAEIDELTAKVRDIEKALSAETKAAEIAASVDVAEDGETEGKFSLREDQKRFSRRRAASENGLTSAELREEIAKSFGAATERMLELGRIDLLPTVAELQANGMLPSHLTEDDVDYGSRMGWVRGDGVVVINGRNIARNEVKGLILHEVGVHVGMEKMIGKELWAKLKREVERLVESGSPQFVQARERVPEETSPDLVTEETIAYLVQHAPELSLVKRIVAAIRQWLYRVTGGNLINITESDLQMMARAALGKAAASEVSWDAFGREIVGERYAHALAQVKTPAFKAWFGKSKVVGKDRAPLVVYRGENVSTRDSNYGGKKFYTTDPNAASAFAMEVAPTILTRATREGRDIAPNVMPVYLRMENPLVIDAKGANWRHVKVGRESQPTDMWVAQAEAWGHDGVVFKNLDENDGFVKLDKLIDVYVPLHDNQVKSAIGNDGRYGPGHDMRYALRDDSPWYFSALVRAAEQAKIAKGNGLQWLNTLRNTPGVKAEEIEWLGLAEWLGSRAGITREEVIEYLRANELQVSEKMLADEAGVTALPDDWTVEPGQDDDGWIVLDQDGDQRGAGDSRAEAIQSAMDEDERAGLERGGQPRYSQHQLPGGEKYRELLLTLPARSEPVLDPAKSDFDDQRKLYDKQDFTSSHFDQPNIVAHVRFNERTDADGKRVLFIEEVQSDWHQAGRKQGYAGSAPFYDVLDAQGRQMAGSTNKADAERLAEKFAGTVKEREIASGIPDAPFKTTWPELALKRMVRYAAENGFDRIAWTTGEQQADRYKLSNTVDSIVVTTRMDAATQKLSGRSVLLYMKDGSALTLGVNDAGVVDNTRGPNAGRLHGKALGDIVGKDMAEKLMAAEAGASFSGEGLDVGARGMKGFYDQILPTIANKLGKKFGARVGTATIKADNAPEDVVQKFAEQDPEHPFVKKNRMQVHSLPITPALKEAALGGQPLFAVRGQPAQAADLSARVDAVAADLRARLEKVGIADRVTLNLRERIRAVVDGKASEADGRYLRGVIDIALSGPAPLRTLNHEVIHALRDLGVIRDAEWRALERAAKADTDLMATIRRRYARAGLSEDSLVEEVIAEMHANWAAGRSQAGGFLRTAFERIRDFLKALGQALRGNGFTTADSVFRGIERGEVGSRQEQPRDEQGRFTSPAEARLAKSEYRGGKYQWMRTKAQEFGNQQIVRPLTEADFNAHIKGTMRKGFPNTFAGYIKRFPDVGISFLSQDRGKTWKFSKLADLADLEPSPRDPRWVIEVKDFGSPEAAAQGAIDDETIDKPLYVGGERVRYALRPEDFNPKQADRITRGEVRFDNAESEARWKDARKGMAGQETLLGRMSEHLGFIADGFTRHFILLPNEARFSEAREQLRKIEAAPQAAKEEVVRVLRDMVKGMTPADVDLFTRKIVLDDLSFEVDQEHQLPFGFTPEDVRRELAKVDTAMTPELMAKVALRRRITTKLADDLVAAGVLHKEQIKNPAYYRHQVLDYARAQVIHAKTTGKKLKTPHWAKRMGSTLDINANLLEAEFEWMQKALTDIAVANTIDWFKGSTYNVRNATVQAARDSNQRLVDSRLAADQAANGYITPTGRQTSPLTEEWNGFKQRIGYGLKLVREANEAGEYLDAPAEFADTIRSLTSDTVEGNLFPFLTWILDNNKAGAQGAALAFKGVNQRKAWTKQLLGERYADPADIDGLIKRGFAPEGYIAWQPDEGNLLFTAKTLPEHVIDRMLDRIAAEGAGPMTTEELRGALESVRSVMMTGGPKYQMILPEEVANTLSTIKDEHADGLFDALVAVPQTMWKRWQLISPRRVIKYNINNLTGDIDAVIAGNPRALKKMPQAIRELWQVMIKNGKPTQQYRDAVERGVFDSGLTVQEIPDINFMSEFENLINPPTFREAPGRFALSPLMKFWRASQKYTQFRENWLRYASYIDYVERLEAGESMASIGYGAANREMVDAVSDNKDRAALLARELVGDYGAISHFGKGIRRKVSPFWSWTEINTKRYWRLGSNAWDQGIAQGFRTTGIIGASVGIRTTAYLTLRMAVLYGLVQLWNNMVMGDEEDELSVEERARLHLILGRTDAGEIVTLRFQGALSDFLAWFGFPDAVGVMSEIERGRADYSDLATTVAKAPVNKVATGLTPVISLPLELASGRTFWPDVFNPRQVQDKWRHTFKAVALEHEYDAIFDRPSRGYGQSLQQALVYKRDVGENAYNRIKGLAHDWVQREKGVEGSGGYTSPRSQALYDWRVAKKFGDVSAERAALDRLRELGVTLEDRAASLKRAHPLGGVSIRDRAAFLRTLTPQERQALEEATQWYQETFLD